MKTWTIYGTTRRFFSVMAWKFKSISSYVQGADCLVFEDFDLIIVNQGSSNFEGRRVLARAIERNRRTPVLVVTRSIEMSCYLEAIQSGAVDYIEKPLLPSQIADLVARSIRTHLGKAGIFGKCLRGGKEMDMLKRQLITLWDRQRGAPNPSAPVAC